ncbi:MAG: SMC family ATPase [Caldisericota bacterium]|nr:SMC family ATPase [Caldisericota bacterium]
MIPEILAVRGFLSYTTEQKLDFTNFHIGLLSGENGQGKSAILDAITFALFSRARGVEGNKKGVEDIVSSEKTNLKVAFQFMQNGDRYRITRTYDKINSKSDILLEIEKDNVFVNISENKIRETDEKILKIIGMNYDAFITSSFILQGKSDFFTAKKPSEKMEIVREMLGLDIYEYARERALNERREIKALKDALKMNIKSTRKLIDDNREIEKIFAEKKKQVAYLKERKEKIEEKYENARKQSNKWHQLKQLIEHFSIEEEKHGRIVFQKQDEVKREKEKLLRIEEMLKRKEEIMNGYNAYVENENLYNELLEKKNKISQAEIKRALLKSTVERETILKVRKQTDLRGRIKQNQDSLKKFTMELRTEKIKNEKLLKNKSDLEVREKEIEKSIFLVGEELKTLRNACKEKEKAKNSIGELERRREERLSELNREKGKLKKEIEDIESALKKIELEVIKKEIDGIEAEIKRVEKEKENGEKRKEELIKRKASLSSEIEMAKANLFTFKEKLRFISEETKNCPLCGSPLTDEHRKEVELKYKEEIAKSENLLYKKNLVLSKLNGEIESIRTVFDAKILVELKEKLGKYVKEIHLLKAVKLVKETQREKILAQLNEKDIALKRDVMSDVEMDVWNKCKGIVVGLNGVEEKTKVKEDALKKKEEKKQQLGKLLRDVQSEQAVSQNKIEAIGKNIDAARVQSEKWLREMEEVKRVLEDPEFLSKEKKEILKIEKFIKNIEFSEKMFNECKEKKKTLQDYRMLFLDLREAKARKEEVEKHLLSFHKEIEKGEKEIKELRGKIKKTAEKVEKLGDVNGNYDSLEKEFKDISFQYHSEHDRMIRIEEKCKKVKEEKSELNKKLIELAKMDDDERILDVCVDMFGKEGIQSLIIRSVVPQIEDISNEILRKMSGGTMQLKFRTVKANRKGEEKNTLDIEVYAKGIRRRYVLFSGGEQFRINLATRIGISLFLASLSGMPLEMLIIDEGFGSQDESGRANVLEELNAIKTEFKKILIITHVAEVKESFPYELRVTKDEQGSHIFAV